MTSHNPPPPTRIRMARQQAGMTQAQAAQTVSVSQSTWKRWESGRHRMPPAMMDMFTIVTGLRVAGAGR